jgi:hypothetical protein
MEMKKCLFLCFLIFFSCSSGNDNATSPSTRSYLMGVGPIWKEYSTPTQGNILDMYQKIADFGEILIVQGLWRDSYSSAGTVPQGIEPYMAMVPAYGYIPQVGINFFSENLGVVTVYLDPSNNTGGVWLNNTTTQNYYTTLVFTILNGCHSGVAPS